MKPPASGPEKRQDIEVLLDSNILLEVLLAQQHSEACRNLLIMVRDGRLRAAITDFHIDSIVLVMENYGKGWQDVLTFLASLFRYRGLTIHTLGMHSRIRAPAIMRGHGLDYDDALAVQALKELSIDTIISYDDDFDGVDWVRRIIPERWSENHR
jgi:predicted nucleic acid-binding protein